MEQRSTSVHERTDRLQVHLCERLATVLQLNDQLARCSLNLPFTFAPRVDEFVCEYRIRYWFDDSDLAEYESQSLNVCAFHCPEQRGERGICRQVDETTKDHFREASSTQISPRNMR